MEDAHITQGAMYAEVPDLSADFEIDADAGADADADADDNDAADGNGSGSGETGSGTSGADDADGAASLPKRAKYAAEAGTTHANATSTDANSKPKSYKRIHLPRHSLFAVFDGHGGSFAAEYAGLNFVRVLARQSAFIQYAHFVQEQEQLSAKTGSGTGTGSDATETNSAAKYPLTQSQNQNLSPQEQAQRNRMGLELLEHALKDAFLDIDREIWREVRGLGNAHAGAVLPKKKSDNRNKDENDNEEDNHDHEDDNDEKLDNNNNDHEEDEEWHKSDSGTTANVVLFTPQWIICANAGDSRSVYSKSGNCTIPLSYDHKPDDEAEERRVYEAGGFVRSGRVEGDLAVSRGLGDFRFKLDELYEAMGSGEISFRKFTEMKMEAKKNGMLGASATDGPNGRPGGGIVVISPEDQKVSPMPDIVVQNRNESQDEFVVLACDGIFDVQTNHECIALATELFRSGEGDLGLLCEEVSSIWL
jgi:serine/threonine protein phosphatase PrpC